MVKHTENKNRSENINNIIEQNVTFINLKSEV